ncbi:glycosyl hydrolase [Aequorivita soesokkakensis]|uniref:Glycosyl hydrolase n=1 Tax=Aequorivita soesokkakensis TaxID=1385699 RepID=A0A1A9LDD9_9FLAO|nr:sialidase family protein [Aequorivita soesokkakensis]OAD90712.1 glycosyl hydrolase [Aequorivita soesokkakensis]
MKKLFLSACCLISFLSFSQQPATPATAVQTGLKQKTEFAQASPVKNLPFKSIGPTIMSGRVVDFAVNPNNPTEFYVGYASGGLWYTNNNGTSFMPVMDSSPTQNVGCVAVDWKNGTIWVGTGEVNASRSSYAGIGLLKSDDKGKTWQNVGLTDSHHISSIFINPANPNEVIVGAVGHLYSNNDERGVFKTTDGGKTWSKTLFINNETGIIEISVNPKNFNTMYAAAWDKDRKAWNFDGSGEGSGVYKSADAGNTWTKVSTENSGLPIGKGMGRIGTAVVDDNTVYLIVDNQFHRKEETKKEETDILTKDDFKKMDVATFLALDDKKLNQFLKMNGFQEKYRSENVKQMVRVGTVKSEDLAKYLEDANSQLFDTPVIGAEVYKSTDGGKTWKKTHDGFLDDLYYSYGYYFGKIHVDPSDANKIYVYGVPILKSADGGKTFESIDADNVHADHHALWINPKMSGHLIDGNDGGVNISYDDGKTWIKNNSPAVGQFYSVNIDHEKNYNVYGGLQDNGVWVGPHDYEANPGWLQNGKYPYEFIFGGDGMQVQIDSRNSKIVYTGFQFGNYYRLNRNGAEPVYIQPKHELGDSPYRFNWQTPILLSSHNQDILYLGGNKLMRSMNQGDDWTAISEDLTQGGKPGNVAYGTLATISESPFQFGLLYTGSDEGLVYVSKDGGGNWTKISDSFPKDLWVSRVIASSHKKERVYVTLNGYRWDNFKPYVYVSENYGATWRDISSNLPTSSINVIKEDPVNENLLYLGTDNGAYVSFNRGESWEVFSKELPNVAVHDLVIQPEAKHLVLGTHGRSIYIADISLLQKLNETNRNEVVLAEIDSLNFSPRWGRKFSTWGEVFEPKVKIQFYSPQAGKATISIKTEDGKELKSLFIETVKGVNIIEYDLSISEKGMKVLEKENVKIKKAENGKYYLPKGQYKLGMNLSTKYSTIVFSIK